MTPTDPPKDSLLSSPGEVLSIKQEPEDPQPNLGSLGLQEITLDDGKKLTVACSCSQLEFTAVIMIIILRSFSNYSILCPSLDYNAGKL